LNWTSCWCVVVAQTGALNHGRQVAAEVARRNLSRPLTNFGGKDKAKLFEHACFKDKLCS
jgi:hypothetical protein